MPTFDDLTVAPPAPGPWDWNDDGVVYLPKMMPDDLMTAYEEEWIRTHGDSNPGGWPEPIAYMRHKPLADLFSYEPLHVEMEKLIQEPVGLHLCLTGWRSTTRDWHQDAYLNPVHVGDSYLAAWIALSDIHPDSGPFQYFPGSHRWPQVTQEQIKPYVDLTDKHWPTHSEKVLTPAFEAEIARRGVEPVTYLPKRGDVLLWHSRLLHRGSKPNVPGMERRAVIGHLSGVFHRPDMPSPAVRHNGGWIFPIGPKTW